MNDTQKRGATNDDHRLFAEVNRRQEKCQHEVKTDEWEIQST